MSDLIDRQALRAAHGLGSDCHDCKRDMKSCQYDRDYSLMDFCEWLDDAPTASPWHRVEDELPEPIHPTDPRYKAYLICDSLGYMHVADYTYSKHFPTCYSFHVNGEEETDVKYWMPIEPPKEDA